MSNAFAAIGCDARLVSGPADLSAAGAIVLPGVGAFAQGMERLERSGLAAAIREEVGERGKPLLGICLGMQLLASYGLEHGRREGLGLIPGRVERVLDPAVDKDLPVPHVGWNDVRAVGSPGIYRHLDGPVAAFYFVHSYVLVPDDPCVISGVCEYGREFAASVQSGPITATQFHPEKSHRDGIGVLRSWAEGIAAC